MKLVRLTYISTAVQGVDEAEVKKIVAQAVEFNQTVQVTGSLFFENGYFLQILEGGRSAVNQLYNHIIQDKRHNNVQLVNYQPIVSRDFLEWHMGYVPRGRLTDLFIKKFGATEEFLPYDMNAESLEGMLMTISGALRGSSI